MQTNFDFRRRTLSNFASRHSNQRLLGFECPLSYRWSSETLRPDRISFGSAYQIAHAESQRFWRASSSGRIRMWCWECKKCVSSIEGDWKEPRKCENAHLSDSKRTKAAFSSFYASWNDRNAHSWLASLPKHIVLSVCSSFWFNTPSKSVSTRFHSVLIGCSFKIDPIPSK